MLIFISKLFISSLIIAFASWLSLKKPVLAGFIIALPLLSILSIAFSFIEHKDFDKTILFAKSILVGVPVSLTFFLPFFFAKSFGLNFYFTYFLGILFLFLAFLFHKFVMNYL
jgi:hypothetical protein|tara:strand:+ start:309 stop:647 length:339 start_codon:yes stop_codon:yes gene_type:complete